LKPIGIVSALAAEARTLGPAVPHGAGLRQLADGALLAVSGIGAGAAAAAARRLVLAGVSALASFGMAGGLDPTLICGAVLLPEEVAAAGGAGSAIVPTATSRDWRRRLHAALPASCIAGGGRLLTIDRPLGRDAKADAWRRSRAAAVDMESAAIAEVAAQAGLPFIALRVIVDTAADELPPAVIAASGGGRLQIGRLLAGLVSVPRDVVPLIRLSARYRIATRVLADVARPGSAARRALVGGSGAEEL
jgi:adenosylhomocysteine nucleosidase